MCQQLNIKYLVELKIFIYIDVVLVLKLRTVVVVVVVLVAIVIVLNLTFFINEFSRFFFIQSEKQSKNIYLLKSFQSVTLIFCNY